MTNKKLTDSEIVKALECCSEEDKCKECPYYNKGNFKCLNYNFFKDLLDLINRLQTKNKKLTIRLRKVEHQLDDAMKMYNIIKDEAYKEFAERLKSQMSVYVFGSYYKTFTQNDIDNLLKELVGGDNGKEKE